MDLGPGLFMTSHRDNFYTMWNLHIPPCVKFEYTCSAHFRQLEDKRDREPLGSSFDFLLLHVWDFINSCHGDLQWTFTVARGDQSVTVLLWCWINSLSLWQITWWRWCHLSLSCSFSSLTGRSCSLETRTDSINVASRMSEKTPFCILQLDSWGRSSSAFSRKDCGRPISIKLSLQHCSR